MTEKELSLSQAKKIIRDQAKRIKELEDEEIAFPFRLYFALEDILDHDPIYQLVPPTELGVYDFQFEIPRKRKFLAKDIICILSEDDSRRKTIYTLEENMDEKKEINKYSINKAGDMETWARFFDKLAHRLIKVSKSAVVNVAYYQLATDNVLYLSKRLKNATHLTQVKISDKKSEYDTFKKDFLKVQQTYRNHILLQKKVLGYKNLIDAIVSGKFVP
jgi:hypothetical protein